MGETADGLNTILSFLRGNVLDGIFSAISMIPGFGDAVAKPVKGILGALGNSKVIKSFVSGLTKFFGSANKAVSGINKVASTIKNLIKQVPKAIKSMKDKLKDTLGSWLSKKINKSLDKVAEFFSKSSDKIVKELDEGVKEVNESIIKFDLQQFASKGTGKTVDVNIPSSLYPETAQHIKDAQKAGHPDVLTIDRPNTNMRRKESLKDQPVVKGMDRDEYPPAMFKEGGTGASVRPISPSDNRGAGSFIGNKLRGVPDGTKVRIKVD